MKSSEQIEKELRAKGIVTTKMRLEVLSDSLHNPKTTSKERWKILMFLLEFHMDRRDVFDWINNLDSLTEGYLNNGRN